MIKDSVREAGSHWFDPSTMRFFGTKVCPSVYQGRCGVFFVTSEQPPHGRRGWTVRKFTPPDDIDTVGDLCEYPSQDEAEEAAMKAAAGESLEAEVEETEEEYEKVGDREQFHFTLQRELPAAVEGLKPWKFNHLVDDLLKLAKSHHQACEALCNTGHDRREPIEEKITALCQKLGCEPLFQGDPRGCTVKLKLPSGNTDDWGKEGFCVPTQLDEDED
jgi:hypothetical protein